nr:helix-turn-helix transcriptional regulator [Algoriphagus sp.]
MVDEVAETLNVSVDSAYRRIRGEKLLDFDELKLLCQRFNLSLDKFLSLNTDSIMFQGRLNTYHEDAFKNWMDDVLAQLNLVNSFSHRHVYFLVKDMPPFHHYYHPVLAGFKFFF